jgi:hypothetical protein
MLVKRLAFSSSRWHSRARSQLQAGSGSRELRLTRGAQHSVKDQTKSGSPYRRTQRESEVRAARKNYHDCSTD